MSMISLEKKKATVQVEYPENQELHGRLTLCCYYLDVMGERMGAEFITRHPTRAPGDRNRGTVWHSPILSQFCPLPTQAIDQIFED